VTAGDPRVYFLLRAPRAISRYVAIEGEHARLTNARGATGVGV